MDNSTSRIHQLFLLGDGQLKTRKIDGISKVMVSS